LARSNKPEHLSEALILEANAWEKGERNPWGISEEWIGEFHANSVASKAIEYLNLNRS
jgi:hypothetical protein